MSTDSRLVARPLCPSWCENHSEGRDLSGELWVRHEAFAAAGEIVLVRFESQSFEDGEGFEVTHTVQVSQQEELSLTAAWDFATALAALITKTEKGTH